jgi:hypothetical protein
MKMNEGEARLCEWQFELAGSFYSSLFHTMTLADSYNLVRLSASFPEEVEAFRNFSNTPGYWEHLQNQFKKGEY